MVGLLVSSTAEAQPAPCTPSNETVCLPKEDFQRFLTIALERQCLQRNAPTFEIDSVAIVTDTDGRVFYSGADAKRPYRLRMKWCHYDIEAAGEVQVVAAMKTPERAGVRFRP